ncbi:amidase [Nocardiopsis sp. NPDC101807]|uniref:amidase n=1 Tax=Nocardiopsis sp. NPDC101807 TaxID=3364339 RepID=UPI00381C5C17
MTDPEDARELFALDIAECGARLRAGTLTSVRLVGAALDRIGSLDHEVCSFLHVDGESALRDAAAADGALAAGRDLGPLHGIPYALKDIFDAEGMPTTCQSQLTVGRMPKEDSEVQARLRAGGAVCLGKLNTHEFALGGPSYELPFPPSRNPWNTEHFTGASSTGAGAAVAAGFVRMAVGSDTSGSIRGPAYHCGVVGLKPTYGLVSRRGAYPLSYSLDHCGPIARSVEDAALAMNVLAGFDPRDPSSVRNPVADHTSGLDLGVEGLKVAFSTAWYGERAETDPEVVTAVERALRVLASRGAEVTEVELPDYDLLNACGRVIMTAEAFAIHEDDLRERGGAYGRYTYQRIMPGVGLTAADLLQAYRLRAELAHDLHRKVFAHHDVLVTAGGLTTAPALGDFPEDWPPPAPLTAMQTIPFNVTGHPAVSVPLGPAANGLPLGVQLAGRHFGEPVLLGAARELERCLPDMGWPPGFAPGAGATATVPPAGSGSGPGVPGTGGR